MHYQHKKKGFTLIELLVVIGILVVLATVIVLVLNPAEIFRQARDAGRVSDLDTLESAITYYVSTVAAPTLFNALNGDTCAAGPWFSTAADGTAIDGTGWIGDGDGLSFLLDDDDVEVPGGSPIAVLPVDPRNIDVGDDGAYVDTTDFFYTFECSDTTGHFRISANMESQRYSNAGGGSDNLEVNTEDGGEDDDLYESGTCVDDDGGAGPCEY